MRKKLIALSVLSVMAISLAVAGCAVATAEITESEQNALENFEFTNDEHVNEYLQFELDNDIQIDGVLNESIWKDNATSYTFEHSASTEENQIEMTVTSYLGNAGFYMAFSVQDASIYYSADRIASWNTSVEAYLGVYDQLEHNGNVFRISIMPTANDACITEIRTKRTQSAKFTEFESLDGSTNWVRWNKQHLTGCRVRGTGINTSDNEGYDIELFVPWDALGAESRPQAVRYVTALYHVESASSSAGKGEWTGSEGGGYVEFPWKWPCFTNEGRLTQEEVDNLLAPVEDGMTIDGVFNETEWSSANRFTLDYTLPDDSNMAVGADPSLTVLWRYTDRGVYLGLEVRDRYVWASAERNINLNTSLEVWVQEAGKTKIDAQTVAPRIDALGRIDRWRGTDKQGTEAHYFKSVFAVNLLGANVGSDGTVRADSATGFDVEFFVPWDALGMSEKGDVAIYPQYIFCRSFDFNTRDNGRDTYFFQINTQTAAKTDSQNAFIRLGETGVDSTLSVEDINFYKAEVIDGKYTADVELYKRVSVNTPKATIAPVALNAVTTNNANITFTKTANPLVWTLNIANANDASYADAVPLSVTADGLVKQLSVYRLNYLFDGVLSADEAYAKGISWTVMETEEVTLYAVPERLGVAVLLTLKSNYLNYANSATGNNGGGFEIRMANSISAEKGIWWRYFADGTARTETNLTAGAPSSNRTTLTDRSTFGMTLVGDHDTHFTTMTIEFYVTYAEVGATGAEDFWIAVAVNKTNPSDNKTTGDPIWMNNVKAPSQNRPVDSEQWIKVGSLASTQVKSTTVRGDEGNVDFKVYSTISNYAYLKGVTFEDVPQGSQITEGNYGVYTLTNATGSFEITAKWQSETAKISFIIAPPAYQYDGVKGESEEYGNPVTWVVYNDTQEVELYLHAREDGVNVLITLHSDFLNYADAATGNNGGGLEIRMSNVMNGASGIWWRYFADGTARTETNLTAGAPSGNRTTLTDRSNFGMTLVGDHSAGFTSMTIEYYVTYADVGATGADDFWIAVAVNRTNRSDNKTTGDAIWMNNETASSNRPAKAEQWLKAADFASFGIKADEYYFEKTGEVSFKVHPTISNHAYLKGVTFTGGTVTEGANGLYTLQNFTQTTTLTASWKGHTQDIKLNLVEPAELPNKLDGTVEDDEYEYSFTIKFQESDVNFADMTVYFTLDDNNPSAPILWMGFVIKGTFNEDASNRYPQLTQATGAANCGNMGMDFAIGNSDLTTSWYYRAYAHGRARSKQYNGSTSYTPGNAEDLDFLCGNHAKGSTYNKGSTGEEEYTLEWKLDLVALTGSADTSEARVLIGWITAAQGDRAYAKGTGKVSMSGDIVSKVANFYSIDDLIALANEQSAALAE